MMVLAVDFSACGCCIKKIVKSLFEASLAQCHCFFNLGLLTMLLFTRKTFCGSYPLVRNHFFFTIFSKYSSEPWGLGLKLFILPVFIFIATSFFVPREILATQQHCITKWQTLQSTWLGAHVMKASIPLYYITPPLSYELP